MPIKLDVIIFLLNDIIFARPEHMAGKMSKYQIKFDALEWRSPLAGLRFKAHTRGGRRLRLVEYTPEMAPHWCENGHIGQVLEGRFEIRYDDETVVYDPGDGIFIPSGAADRHMGRALTDVVRIIFVEDA